MSAPGTCGANELERLYRRAACVVSPSKRDGFGMVVAEAAARRPVVVSAGPDNAAAERVVEGENGALAPSSAPHDLADAILRVLDAGERLREHGPLVCRERGRALDRGLARAGSLHVCAGRIRGAPGRFGKAPPREGRL